MQIVRDLGGYTLGRSDLVRRAMSKKKQSVMEKERENFVHGNPEEGVPGCVANGIREEVASHIYDEMMDFAKYAFNKSHAACYAVVAYQTAFLKHYYPVEFMAALMTSVIDNSGKVSEYILTCRSMGISILPPDVNQGESGFSVKDGQIRYALTAIKGVGRPVIEALASERQSGGPFLNLKDFISRMSEHDINKRVIESCIKAGALDSLGGTRKQFMTVYSRIMEHMAHDKKNNMAGQLSLFDIVAEEDRGEFDIPMPDVGEYEKEMLLGFEKEVLGVYISGHPMEEYQQLWKRHITNITTDFALDEETGETKVSDQAFAVVGGMISGKNIKYTKNDKVMAFLTLEDLVGSVEVVVFPQSYEEYGKILQEDAKIFVKGRVSLKEEKDGNLICEQIISFDEARDKTGSIFENRSRGFGRSSYGGRGGQSGNWNRPKEPGQEEAAELPGADVQQNGRTPGKVPDGVWIQFNDNNDYLRRERELMDAIRDSDGNDSVVIYLKDNKVFKILPRNLCVRADEELKSRLGALFGPENVKFRIKSIENREKID